MNEKEKVIQIQKSIQDSLENIAASYTYYNEVQKEINNEKERILSEINSSNQEEVQEEIDKHNYRKDMLEILEKNIVHASPEDILSIAEKLKCKTGE